MECKICPRRCGANRENKIKGVCGVSNGILVSKTMLHHWEEPCISGKKGSGAVFFSGCPLHCIYCQNNKISDGKVGKEVTVQELSDIFLQLQEMGAANINLVTPTHYSLQILEALKIALSEGLTVPVVYNCSGYEAVDTLKMFEGIVSVYLTDFKYMDKKIALEYSKASDYPEIATKALLEMHRQMKLYAKPFSFNTEGYMTHGIIVRSLLLPGHVNNSKAVLKRVYELCGNDVFISIMNQYTPLEQVSEHPLLKRNTTKREYKRLLEYAFELGISNAFIQEGDAAKESFIPDF